MPDFPAKIFAPLGKIWELINASRARMYTSGWLKSQKIGRPVIVVGNLSSGGSGKTPLVIYLLQKLSQQNIAVLLRGYKGRKTAKPRSVNEHSTPKDVGDEAKLIYTNTRQLPEKNIQVIVHPKRYLAACWAMQNIQPTPEVFVLDDGFQHLNLQRDLNICLLDCSDPQLHYALPVGSRREGFAALRRADIILLNRTEHNPTQTAQYKSIIQKHAPDVPLFELRSKISGFRDPDNQFYTAEQLRGSHLLAFAGLANNRQFFQELKETCLLNLEAEIAYNDHHAYPTATLDQLEETAQYLSVEHLICTGKDAIKIQASEHAINQRLLVAKQELEIAGEAEFWRLLRQKIMQT